MNRILAATVLAVLGVANPGIPAGAGIAPGNAAPAFRLQDQDGNWVSLAELRSSSAANIWRCASSTSR